MREELHNTGRLDGGSALLGVSLSNRVFTRRFVERFGDWLEDRRVARVEVVVFEELEAINYQMFRGVDPEGSLRVAARRGRELVTMFRRALDRRSFGCTVISESQAWPRNPAGLRVREKLQEGYRRHGYLRETVRRQIIQNLRVRVAKHGNEFIEARLDGIAEYVLGEIAFMYAYFDRHPYTVEMYPGPRMPLMTAVLRGDYERETGLQALRVEPAFVDVSFLCDRLAEAAPQAK